jgi:tubulin---tyrosine ligase
MADRGNGIRLFNDRKSLEDIFSEFEEQSDEEEEEDEEKTANSTAVVTSQLRHFVIQVHCHVFFFFIFYDDLFSQQEYLATPMLLDPSEKPLDGFSKPDKLRGHKVRIAYPISVVFLTLINSSIPELTV